MEQSLNRKLRKVLVATYVFPPSAAVGVYRILKFCKYLPAFGWMPVILTPSNPTTLAKDESLSKLVPPSVQVERTPYWDPFRSRVAVNKSALPGAADASKRWRTALASPLKRTARQLLGTPDSAYLWSWSGLFKGWRAVIRERVDVILTSGPPQSTHILGYRLSRLCGKPLVVDFRDLWTLNTRYNERSIPPLLQKRDSWLESLVLRRASAISVNTATFKEQLLEKHPFLTENQLHVITNGVDPDDFRGFAEASRPNDRFTMVYAGSLYGRQRNPGFFLDALRNWIDREPDAATQASMKFIGNISNQHLSEHDLRGLTSVVEVKGWMPQSRVMEEIFAADLLILIQGFDPVLHSAIPRKLYDYMIANKMILAFAPDGEISELLSRYRCGYTVDSPATEPIVHLLRCEFDRWRQARTSGHSEVRKLRNMPELETSLQVSKLADAFDRITE